MKTGCDGYSGSYKEGGTVQKVQDQKFSKDKCKSLIYFLLFYYLNFLVP